MKVLSSLVGALVTAELPDFTTADFDVATTFETASPYLDDTSAKLDVTCDSTHNVAFMIMEFDIESNYDFVTLRDADSGTTILRESGTNLVSCKWFDAGTSSLEIMFDADYAYSNYDGVNLITACVATSDQFTNRLEWSQSQGVADGDCSNVDLSTTTICDETEDANGKLSLKSCRPGPDTPCTANPCNDGTCSVVGDSYTCDCTGTDKVGANCHLEDCVGNDIFAVTCMDDFKVKIDVEQMDCFKQEYPTLTLNDLIVMANAAENDVDAGDTCKAFGGTGAGSNFIYSNADLSVKVSETSTELYFDGKVCGADAAYDATSNTLVYKAKLGTYIHDDDTQVLFNPAMIAVPITCKYTPSVDGEAIALDSLVLDNPKKSGTTKVEEAAEATAFSVTAAVSIKQPDGSYAPLDEDDKVMLGEEVKVTFTSSADLAIHIATCTGQDDATTPTNTLAIVQDDCFLTESTGDDALEYVQPTHVASAVSGVTVMTMNQFAFIDANSASEPNPDLVFHMKCKIEIGDEECGSRRRRRQANNDFIDVTYEINSTRHNYAVDDGIVHLVETTSASLANVVSFVTIIVTLMFL